MIRAAMRHATHCLALGAMLTGVFAAAWAPSGARADETGKQQYFRQQDRFEKEQAAREIADQIERYRKVQGNLEPTELERLEEDARLGAIEKYESILERIEALDEPELEDIVHRLAVLYAEHEAGQYRRGHDVVEDEERYHRAGILKGEPPPVKPDFRRSKRLYRILLDRFPKSKYADEAMYFLGYATEEEDGMEAALPFYEALLDQYPKSRFTTESEMRLGEYYFFLDDFARARGYYERVVAAGPSEFLEKGLFKLGWCHFIEGNHAKARETFLSLLDAFAANPKVKRGELFTETVEALAKSYAEDSSEAELKAIAARSGATGYGITIYQALANLYRDQSRYADAVGVYSYLLKTYPTYEGAPDVMGTYIDSLSVEKRLDEANELREQMVTNYGPGSAWWEANPNPELRANALKISEHMLTVVTQYYHGKAQRDHKPEDWANAIRLYRKYLAAFPDSPERLDAQFSYAQALYDTRDFHEAIAQFGEVAHHADFEGKPNPYVEKAAYFRVLAVNEIAKTQAVPVELTIQVYGEYIALNPTSERVPQLLFKQGEILYNAKAYARAAEYFDKLATEHPNDSRAKEAHLLATQAFFQAEDYPAVERRARFNLTRLDLTPDEREKQERMVALSMFKEAEQLGAAGDTLAAANRYADLYAEFPGRDVAPNALYNAGLGYRKIGRKSEALAAFETLVRKHETSEFAFDALLLAVAIHEEDDNWRAVEDKLDIAERLAPRRPEVREIGWRLAEWAGTKGTRADAVRLYGRYRQRYPNDVDRNLTGEYRIFVKDFEALPKEAPEGDLGRLLSR
ncbi:MAG: tetratricopeptide repeat protein, partial [Myxococcales bacterium]|nr:tetratricopeptide repeat protein [Myxococcales bacterium]